MGAAERLLIDGQRVDSSSEEVFDLRSPVDGSIVATVVEASADDASSAVASAAKAFRGEWPRISPRERRRLMNRVAALIREHAEELAQLETRNVGKPIGDSRDEVGLAADCFEYYGGTTDKIGGQTLPSAARG